MNQSHAAALAAAAAAWAALGAPGAAALEATASVSHTAEYTSNTARTETDEIGEWVHAPGVDVTLSEASTQVTLDAGYHYERRFHEEDLFDDENAVTGSAQLVWHALPQRLDLTVRNTRTESTQRSLSPNTEGNRQTVSNTDVGPTLRFRPQRNAELQLEYLYTDVDVDETPTDSQRHTGNLRYVVNLSAVRALTFGASYRDVDFDNPLAPDLQTTTGTLTLESRGSSLRYHLTGGYSLTEREQGRDDVDGAIFDLALSWDAGAETVLELTAGRQITDQADNLFRGRLDFGDEVNEETDLNEVFTETNGQLTLRRPFGNTGVALSIGANDQDYEDVGRDNERLMASLRFDRALTRRASLNATLQASRRKFTSEDREQDEYRASLSLRRELTRRLGLGIGVHYEEWDSNDAGRSYDEWVGSVTLGYRLLGEAR